jgi:3-hydroxybutyryl-CoA dehydrogenase
MGSGIAQVCAEAGLEVFVVEPSERVISRDLARIETQLAKRVERGSTTQEQSEATLARIHAASELTHASSAELVIEAAPERLDLKLDIFHQLDAIVDEGCVLATNTSALSITQIAASTARPERVCGLHWFNPAPVLDLVEVVRGERTDDATLARAWAFVQQVGKHPILCNDTPGFIVNRIIIPVLNDAITLWDQKLASAEDIDAGCKLGLGWPMGPLALCDLIGLDVAKNAAQALYDANHEPRMAPPTALVRMVASGKLGRKSGEGFYRYE